MNLDVVFSSTDLSNTKEIFFLRIFFLFLFLFCLLIFLSLFFFLRTWLLTDVLYIFTNITEACNKISPLLLRQTSILFQKLNFSCSLEKEKREIQNILFFSAVLSDARLWVLCLFPQAIGTQSIFHSKKYTGHYLNDSAFTCFEHENLIQDFLWTKMKFWNWWQFSEVAVLTILKQMFNEQDKKIAEMIVNQDHFLSGCGHFEECIEHKSCMNFQELY